jgi:hypothetical protein
MLARFFRLRVNCDQAIPYPPDGQSATIPHSASISRSGNEDHGGPPQGGVQAFTSGDPILRDAVTFLIALVELSALHKSVMHGKANAAKSNPSAAIGPRSPSLTFVCQWFLSPV